MRLGRYFPWMVLVIIGAILAARWATQTNGASGTVSPAPPPGLVTTKSPTSHVQEKHYVTPRQLAAANGMVARVVRDSSVTMADGHGLAWEELSAGLPVVLVFIKAGCPCSVDFEPFFHRVEKRYHGEAHFVGVIDADPTTARRYAREQHVPYPILADPDRQLIRRLRAENGGYVMLLTPQGVIDGCWPGCTADTMRELGRRIARLAGVTERPLNLSGMPGPLTTGCPFES